MNHISIFRCHLITFLDFLFWSLNLFVFCLFRGPGSFSLIWRHASLLKVKGFEFRHITICLIIYLFMVIEEWRLSIRRDIKSKELWNSYLLSSVWHYTSHICLSRPRFEPRSSACETDALLTEPPLQRALYTIQLMPSGRVLVKHSLF